MLFLLEDDMKGAKEVFLLMTKANSNYEPEVDGIYSKEKFAVERANYLLDKEYITDYKIIKFIVDALTEMSNI